MDSISLIDRHLYVNREYIWCATMMIPCISPERYFSQWLRKVRKNSWSLFVRFGFCHAYKVRDFGHSYFPCIKFRYFPILLIISLSHLRPDVLLFFCSHGQSLLGFCRLLPGSHCKRHLNRDNWNDKYQRCCGSGETCDQSYSYCDN